MYKIQRNSTSINGKYQIYSEDELIYEIKNKSKLLGSKFEVCDKNGVCVAKVNRKMSLITPKYDILVKDNFFTTVEMKMGTKPSFLIEECGWFAESDAYGVNHRILSRSNKSIATIKKELNTFEEIYNIKILENESEIKIDIVIDTEIDIDINKLLVSLAIIMAQRLVRK